MGMLDNYQAKTAAKFLKKLESVSEEEILFKYAGQIDQDYLEILRQYKDARFTSSRLEDKELGPVTKEYFELLRKVRTAEGLNTLGSDYSTRLKKYEIYEEMDESTTYISSALDILSDDATQPDSSGAIIHIQSSSEKVTSLVLQFLQDFEIEERLPAWTRSIAKYGDLFLEVEGELGSGIVSVSDSVYPSEVSRIDLDGKLVAFTRGQDAQELYTPWSYVHFRHKGDLYKEDEVKGRGYEGTEKRLSSSYGHSILRPAIKVYAQLRFIENMILLSRLTNSIRRNIFLVKVADTDPGKAYETLSMFAGLLKKDVKLNLESGIYNSAKHMTTYDEDIIVPVDDIQNDFRVEQVGGDVNIKEAYDLDYVLNKLFSALKVPKAYLNYEQDLNARSTLIQLDVRYARSVRGLQSTVTAGLSRLLKIHLSYLGLDPYTLDLKVTLTSVSTIDDSARVESLQSSLDVASKLLEFSTDMLSQEGVTDVDKSKLVDLHKYICDDILRLPTTVTNSLLDLTPTGDLSESTRLSEDRSFKSTPTSDHYADYPSPVAPASFEKLLESIVPTGD